MISKNDRRIPFFIGSSFIFKNRYCIVRRMYKYNFEYEIQNSPVKGYMTYDYYMTTPSYIGKQKKYK